MIPLIIIIGIIIGILFILLALVLIATADTPRSPYDDPGGHLPDPPSPNAHNGCRACQGKGGWPDSNTGWDHCPHCLGDPQFQEPAAGQPDILQSSGCP